VNQPVTRRENQRYSVDFGAEVTRGTSTVHARVLNASLGGLFMVMEEGDLPRLGDKVKVRFEIGAHVIDASGVVRWHGPHGAGVQFDSLRARDVYELAKYFEGAGPA
jgi:hypothetical protein